MKLNRTVFLFFVGNKNSTVRIVFNYLSKKKKKRRRRSNRGGVWFTFSNNNF